ASDRYDWKGRSTKCSAALDSRAASFGAIRAAMSSTKAAARSASRLTPSQSESVDIAHSLPRVRRELQKIADALNAKPDKYPRARARRGASSWCLACCRKGTKNEGTEPREARNLASSVTGQAPSVRERVTHLPRRPNGYL